MTVLYNQKTQKGSSSKSSLSRLPAQRFYSESAKNKPTESVEDLKSQANADNDKLRTALEGLKQLHQTILSGGGAQRKRVGERTKRSLPRRNPMGGHGRNEEDLVQIYFKLETILRMDDQTQKSKDFEKEQIRLSPQSSWPSPMNSLDKLVRLKNKHRNPYLPKYFPYQNTFDRTPFAVPPVPPLRVKRQASFAAAFAGDNGTYMEGLEAEAASLLRMAVHTVQQPYPCYDRDM